MSSNLILVLCGAACLGFCSLLLYKALPRASRPDSALVASEGRAMSIAMLLLILLFAGLTMIVKGLMP